MNETPRKEQLDVSKIFLAYLVACGDPVRTAQIAQCGTEDVLYLARTELWDAKLEQQSVLKGATPEEARQRTRELNRATCYVQALRLREIVDRTLAWCYEDEKNILNFCTERDKQGMPVFSTKPVLELVKAAEVCQSMLYRALGDTVVKTDVAASGNSLKDLHRLMVTMGDHLTGPDEKKIQLASQVEIPIRKVEAKFLDAESALEP